MRIRIDLRSRWREWLAVALFAGLAGGLVIAAAAGARRTDSALTRHLVAYRFPDAQIQAGNDSADNRDSYFKKTIAHVRTLPQVTASAETAELGYCARDRYDRPVEVTGPNAVLFTVNVDGRYGVSLRRPKLLSGRLPDPRRAREVLLDSRTAGRFGVEPGDVIPMRVFPVWTPLDFTCDPLHERPEQKGIPLVRGLRQILLACEGAVPCRRRKLLADRLYARLRNGASFARLVRRYSDFPAPGGSQWVLQGQQAAPFDRAAFNLPTGGLSQPIRTQQFGWHIVQATSNIVAIGPLIRLRVVGIAATTDSYPLGAATLTPAFHRRYRSASRYASYSMWVRLRHGAADLPALGAARGDLVPQADSTAKLQPSIHHQAQALWVAAAFGALLGLLLVAPALLRLAAAAAADNRTLETIGMTRAQLHAVDVMRAVAIGIVAAAVSVAIAFVVSPLTPIGVARELEPSPGFAFDVAALVVGAGAVTVALVLVGAFTSRRTPEVHPGRTGSPADTLARWRLPLTTISGVRLALARGPRTSSVPTAATVLSATVAVAVVAVALTFTASLQHLFSTPRLYGQNWDYRTNYDVPLLARTRADPSISDAAQGDETSILVNGRRVTVSAMDDVKGRIGPVVAAGRPPVRTDELALSRNTLATLHLDIGDTVEAQGSRSARMRIVGRVVLPESVCDCARPRGAMTFEALKRLEPDSSPIVFEARIAADADRDATLARLQRAYVHPPPGPPKTVADFEGIRKLPVVASVWLAAIAAVALAHTLVTAIRRRRRHLAVLKTIGFDRWQVFATVTWQALTFAALGLLLGLPLGIAAGRWTWYLFARQIDVVPEPVTPVALILLLVPAAVLLAIVVAAAPAWSAARTRAAVVLRAE